MSSAVMHRMQILIPQWQYYLLAQWARQSNRSIADVIRDLVEKEAKARQQLADEDPIWDVVGIARSGLPHDASERVDELLYTDDVEGR